MGHVRHHEGVLLQGVVTNVDWGRPNSKVRLRIENKKIPAGFTQRELPQDADEQKAKLTLLPSGPTTTSHGAAKV